MFTEAFIHMHSVHNMDSFQFLCGRLFRKQFHHHSSQIVNLRRRQSNWIRSGVLTDDLLALIESGIASKVLACIGNSNRLAILLEILRGPKTVASLVEKCGFGSTGQVYHHMKPLLAADIIVEDEHQKGAYVVQPHKVQGVIMLLAGISDMVDETYTKGTWEADGENSE